VRKNKKHPKENPLNVFALMPGWNYKIRNGYAAAARLFRFWASDIRNRIKQKSAQRHNASGRFENSEYCD
jgi:hypothetical protein